jgi:glycosyltransferase involved in cell wall biosynthesis
MRAFIGLLGEVRRRDTPAIIYDAEALFVARDVMQAQLRGVPLAQAEIARRMSEEVGLAAQADLVIAVTEEVAAPFREAGRVVRVLGHALTVHAAEPGFADRSGFLFVGPVYDDDFPNGDALIWFADEILPRIRAAGRADSSLTVVGTVLGPEVEARADGRLVLRGALPELRDEYARARVFVAPIRIAAGLPLKVLDAAAHGVPSVITPVLARCLGWDHGREALVAETPAEFAAACLQLHADTDLWNRIRANALARVRADADREKFDRTVGEVVSLIKARRGS